MYTCDVDAAAEVEVLEVRGVSGYDAQAHVGDPGAVGEIQVQEVERSLRGGGNAHQGGGGGVGLVGRGEINGGQSRTTWNK